MLRVLSMTDKPNCRNCHAIHDDRCPIEFATDKCDAYRTTQITGCLFNPGAREWLMKDVIEYLEQYLITETFGGYSETDVAYSKLARETIHLIRGDGK